MESGNLHYGATQRYQFVGGFEETKQKSAKLDMRKNTVLIDRDNRLVAGNPICPYQGNGNNGPERNCGKVIRGMAALEGKNPSRKK